MRRLPWVIPIILAAAGAAYLAARPRPGAQRSVVVTTTMLECAVRELLPNNADVPIVTIMPAGSCPGHFDVPPSVATSLREAKLVLAHSYQGSLLIKLSELAPPETKTAQIETKHSLLIPEHYLALAQQVADALEKAFPAYSAEIHANLQRLDERTKVLTATLLRSNALWADKTIIVSKMQREFAEWLELKPVGTVARPEDVTPGELETLMKSQPALIIGNLQEGPQAAAALAERLKVPLVVFSNFPSADGYGQGYEALLHENIRRLEAVCRNP